jgi:hypothetical protein
LKATSALELLLNEQPHTADLDLDPIATILADRLAETRVVADLPKHGQISAPPIYRREYARRSKRICLKKRSFIPDGERPVVN